MHCKMFTIYILGPKWPHIEVTALKIALLLYMQIRLLETFISSATRLEHSVEVDSDSTAHQRPGAYLTYITIIKPGSYFQANKIAGNFIALLAEAGKLKYFQLGRIT